MTMLVLIARSLISLAIHLATSISYLAIIPITRVALSGLNTLSPKLGNDLCHTIVHQVFAWKFKLPFVIDYESLKPPNTQKAFSQPIEISSSIYWKWIILSFNPICFTFTFCISSTHKSILNMLAGGKYSAHLKLEKYSELRYSLKHLKLPGLIISLHPSIVSPKDLIFVAPFGM